MMVLLTKLPTMGTSPQRNVIATTSGPYGSRTPRTKIAVNVVLISEIVICAPMTVAKLR